VFEKDLDILLVSQQLTDYVRITDLLQTFQSVYRPHHSTETADLHVLSEFLTSIDHGDISSLALLDLSAAFDTVDHIILLKRLKSSFVIIGSATVGCSLIYPAVHNTSTWRRFDHSLSSASAASHTVRFLDPFCFYFIQPTW
jgi:hypothetical protein